ncbi:MAG: GTP-binding protein, partial [Plesiomonas shigelloides]
MLIATAGHVDHGKTRLLQALTGINADRLPEEQRRGMTIDLGYAYWPQPDGRVIGFIDVPGHEKFLANMLAGIGGIDHALLLVACDDGVMPQTREHLHLLQLSGVPTLSV